MCESTGVHTCIYGLDTFYFLQSNHIPRDLPRMLTHTSSSKEPPREPQTQPWTEQKVPRCVPRRRDSAALCLEKPCFSQREDRENATGIALLSSAQSRPDFCHATRLLIGCSLCFSRWKSLCSTSKKPRERRRLVWGQTRHSDLVCGRLSPSKAAVPRSSPWAAFRWEQVYRYSDFDLVIVLKHCKYILSVVPAKENNYSCALLSKTGLCLSGPDAMLMGSLELECSQPLEQQGGLGKTELLIQIERRKLRFFKFTTEQKCRKVLLEQCQISLFHCVEAGKGISTLHLHTACLWKHSGKGSSLCEEEREVQKISLTDVSLKQIQQSCAFRWKTILHLKITPLPSLRKHRGGPSARGTPGPSVHCQTPQGLAKQSLGAQSHPRGGIMAFLQINQFHQRQQAVTALMARDQGWRRHPALLSPAAESVLWPCLLYNPLG